MFYFLLQHGLRQLDLSLLSQLWTLNESIQEFRNLVNNRKNSQQSLASSNSDLNSSGSDNEEGDSSVLRFKNNHHSQLGNESEHNLSDAHQKLVQRMKTAPPAPPKPRSSQV